MKARIVVNRHIAKANRKNGTRIPPLSVQTSRGVFRGSRIELLNTEDDMPVGAFVYSPDKPLKCGATIWFETRMANILLDGIFLPFKKAPRKASRK